MVYCFEDWIGVLQPSIASSREDFLMPSRLSSSAATREAPRRRHARPALCAPCVGSRASGISARATGRTRLALRRGAWPRSCAIAAPTPAMRGATRGAGVALGHRRLSIIDLSPAGAQPMVSSCGRFVISYQRRGLQLRRVAPRARSGGRRFRGHSDTEVIVEGAAVWGVEATVKRLIGMFAMALWDRRERVLYLVRDRLGIKPLYWAKFGDDADLRLGAEGVARLSRLAARARPRCPRRLPALSIRARRRARSIEGVQQAAAGHDPAWRAPAPSPSCARSGRSRMSRAQGQAARFAGSEDEAVDRARCSARRRGAAAHDRRRAAGRVPLGRHRFLDGGRADAGAERAPGAQLLDRLPRTRATTRRRTPKAVARASRHRSHRALRLAASTRSSVIPRLPEMLRRAVRRRLADSDLPGVGDDARARHRGAVGRRRRRAVRRLQPLFPAAALAAARSTACRAAPRSIAAAAIRAVPRAAWTALAPCIPNSRRPAAARRQAAEARRRVMAGGSDDFYRLVVSPVAATPRLVPRRGRAADCRRRSARRRR